MLQGTVTISRNISDGKFRSRILKLLHHNVQYTVREQPQDPKASWEHQFFLRSIKVARSKGIEPVTPIPMAPLLQKIHKSYLRILNGGRSPPTTPTVTAPPQGSLDILLAENDASSSIVQGVDEEGEFFYDADDVPGPVLLDPSMHVTPPSIIFDVDGPNTLSNDENLGLAVPSSSSSLPDDITRISDARRVSIPELSISFTI